MGGSGRRRKEALVACGDKMSDGISVWDSDTGELLLRLPTCASPPHGLLCLRGRFLAASQLQNHRPFAGGALFLWPLNKPQSCLRSYPIEEIGPIASTKDGIYLAGGTPSGNAYIWEVPCGRLLKTWKAHSTLLNCLAFSSDDSFLISGSEDGIICVWLMISVLNTDDPQACGSLPPFCILSEHKSAITNLVPVSGCPTPALLSSCIDGTCKVWDLISGRQTQTHFFPAAVTAMAVDPKEQMLLSGLEDGKIHVSTLDIGMLEIPAVVVSEDGYGTLCGHKGPITVLTFNTQGLWLISASKDGTACLWDAVSWQVIRRLDHGKGYVTNLIVIPQSSLTAMDNLRNSPLPRISLLEKGPHLSVAQEATATLLPKEYPSHDGRLDATAFRTSTLLNKQLLDLEQGRMPEAIEMKVETSVENRLCAISMTKQITKINRHLQSRLLDIIQYRLCHESVIAYVNGRRCNPKD